MLEARPSVEVHCNWVLLYYYLSNYSGVGLTALILDLGGLNKATINNFLLKIKL